MMIYEQILVHYIQNNHREMEWIVDQMWNADTLTKCLQFYIIIESKVK